MNSIDWWNNIGSATRPEHNEDHAEFAARLFSEYAKTENAEIISLRKKCQKLESNIIKNSSANRIDIPCNCENPNYTKTTATKTNKICTLCAGV